jgi:hypothetical protein
MQKQQLDDNDDYESESGEFQPMTEMPTSRLNDIVAILKKGTAAVVNIDAVIPKKRKGELVFKSLLHLMPSSVRTLSIRFNSFSPNSVNLLVEWLATNDYLETLYIMGCLLEDRDQERIDNSWKKNLCGHKRVNMGCTL